MARVTYVKKAQQRYEMVPVIDPETGQQKVTPVMGRNGEQKTSKRGPVFMRVTEADKSKPLPNLKCEKCGIEIKPGGEVYRESAQNMEDGFGHETYQSAELNEKADALESAADEIESAALDLEEFDEDAARQEVLAEADDFTNPEDPEGDDLDPDEYDWEADLLGLSDAVEEKRNEHLDAQRETAEEAASAADAL